MKEGNTTELMKFRLNTLFQFLWLWLKVWRPWRNTTRKCKDHKCSEERTSIAGTMKIQKTNKNDCSIDKNMHNSWTMDMIIECLYATSRQIHGRRSSWTHGVGNTICDIITWLYYQRVWNVRETSSDVISVTIDRVSSKEESIKQ